MGVLPKKFPEYSIMYKTILKQIAELEKRKENTTDDEFGKMESRIQKYQVELDKIKKMFPDNFLIRLPCFLLEDSF